MPKLRPGLCLILLASPLVWAGGNWHVQGTNAMVSMDMVNAKKRNVVATLLVSFNPKSGCAAEVAAIVTEGAVLGTLRNQQVEDGDRMTVTINGQAFSDTTALRTYTNGFESSMWASSDLLAAIGAGGTAKVRMLSGTPWFEFNIGGASEALRHARSACR